MQDTSPAAKKPRDERRSARSGDTARAQTPTWFEDSADRPVDEPLIALLPLPDSS